VRIPVNRSLAAAAGVNADSPGYGTVNAALATGDLSSVDLHA
jgi:hypothetical protein